MKLTIELPSILAEKIVQEGARLGVRPEAIVEAELVALLSRTDYESILIPSHHSPVRSLWAKGHNETYRSLKGLEAARGETDAAVIMEGDSGGQIYLTCPVGRVVCSEDELEQLLNDISTWQDGDEIFYEVLPIGSSVGGGMGGGLVIDGVWLHDELESMGIRAAVEDVIYGRSKKLDSSSIPEEEFRSECEAAAEIVEHVKRNEAVKGDPWSFKACFTDSTRSAYTVVFHARWWTKSWREVSVQAKRTQDGSWKIATLMKRPRPN